MAELEHQREKDHCDGKDHDHGEIAESFGLFLVLAADFQCVAGRQAALERSDLGQGGIQHLGWKHVLDRKRCYRHRAELLAPDDLFGLGAVRHCRNQTEWNLLAPLRGIHVQILDVRDPCALFHAQPSHNRYLLVPLAQCRDGEPVEAAS
jgi:hypothetical protein